MAAIELHRLVKRFGDLTVIPALDLAIRDEEFVVFVGPSGCGKSTLLRIIAGLESIDSGDLFIGGQRVNDMPPARRDIAMVFQDYALYPHMTVRQNMAFGLEMRNTPKDEITRRVERAAAMLHMAPYLERKPKALSGGQRQRVAMGRAMVRNPQVFLFDEPLSNLDAKLRGEVRTEIKALAQQLKTTMVFVTHDQVEAMTMADRIVVLKAGVVQQFGTPEEVYQWPANQFVAGFIGAPSMNFFDVQIEGRQLRMAEGLLLALPPRCGTVAGPAGPAVLGVRPEHLRVLPGDAPGLRVQISVVEPLGSDTLVYFERAGQRHMVRVAPELRLRPGERITLDLAIDKCHLFDKSSGAALRD
ncbi:ABC transporter ATP-binding protein [Verminephrobacter eiseniae]|uniref:ABC transporter related n=1 Tax=Verminephrobacter eiseniae (strain EF01-2) TaxID=391735 RepID=A1WG23_VEREI|nr:sn-glycerol-3-phosphate ABC transporter ATP-binding protein UgpC [Verminephrobacter eiseniae]ABM56580.1 ABC transporter related [Verminephrobacter eiseniae EF01-2]MCW5286937.1 sn-glycerol-3-phosphate ABC transporter ATP-binding protein UgpC [Verminephrobacter eiseniae]MCW5305235.1 sn-glycerol-3-phosphate ABC transporter ATP-binding protein UgpC [Verminephrobacter eiseniae]MCW8178740.1 sn-glycerol-3-phosphate ABC transporter ATP-binding protein UgpC [Verminephrobacter eiseniae]MCW8189469.1 s